MNIIDRIKLAVADSRIGAAVNPVYDLLYKPYGREESKHYKISRPFDVTKTGFTAYAYGEGIRSFRNDRIVCRKVSHFRLGA